MGGGITAEVSIDGPADCPIATVSAEAGTSIYAVSKSVPPGDAEGVTEEFVLDTEAVPDVDPAVEEVFSYGGETVYRFTRERGTGCPCGWVEQFDCPVVDATTRDGVLHLAFHAPDVETLNDAFAAVREAYPGMRVRRLLRSDGGREDADLVCVDRGSLTDRQREVPATAYEMCYFEHPRESNAGEVAEALGITTSTFTEHLSAAQGKIMDTMLED